MWRFVLQILLVIFLFYSNLLMGEFVHSGPGQKMGLLWSLNDIFTMSSFMIAVLFALIGSLVLEILRKRF